jgi:adenylate cyclase
MKVAIFFLRSRSRFPGVSGEEGARDEAARGRLARLREAAVKVDSHPVMLGAVERLRRRVPGDAKLGDSVGPESALLEFGKGAFQVWQSLAESAGRGRGEREVTIVFTDLVGFSSWALQVGDEPALELLRRAGDAVEDELLAAGGTIVKRLGDGVMAVFDDPQRAVESALAAHEALAGVEVEGDRPRMRVGLHHGMPRKVGGDYLGVDVNIAARVAEQAKAGEVLVSESTWERLEGLQSGRAKRLKAEGAPREMRVRCVAR